MNNVPYSVSTRAQLPECWLHRNRQFEYVGGVFRNRTLPAIYISNEEELKELNIPYRVIKDWFGIDVCEFWDPEVYREEEVTLPLYIELPSGDYRYANKNHTEVVPDEETVAAANRFKGRVLSAIEELRRKKKEEALYNSIKETLGEKEACGYYSGAQRIPENFFSNNEHFKLIPVMMPKYVGAAKRTGWYAVFNVNQIELNSVIKLEVQKGKEGLFIGTNAWQVKEWCEQLGVKRINVVGV